MSEKIIGNEFLRKTAQRILISAFLMLIKSLLLMCNLRTVIIEEFPKDFGFGIIFEKNNHTDR